MKSKVSNKANDKRKVPVRKTGTVKRKPSVSLVHQPAEEEIRKLANELYLSRLVTGEEGSEESDWLIAEAILNSKNVDERAA